MQDSEAQVSGAAAPPAKSAEVTRLLRRWRGGDPAALDGLLPLVYEELRRLAQRSMRGERADITLQPTALVAEAYLRLVDMEVAWNDRVHFFAVAANLMRRILVDEARRRQAQKRGGADKALSLEELSIQGFELADPGVDTDLMLLDQALTRLEAIDERKGKVVELRCFAGMTIEETAQALGVSHATVERDLKMAKAWLAKEMQAGSVSGAS
jgi:RNA polymerase sigma-70 factor (ECF subfamily)